MSGGWQQIHTNEPSEFLRGVNEGYRTWCLRNQKIQWLLRALESASPQEQDPKVNMRVQQLKALTTGQVEDTEDVTLAVFKDCEAELLQRGIVKGASKEIKEKDEDSLASQEDNMFAGHLPGPEAERGNVERIYALSDVLAEGVTDPQEREEILKRKHAGSAKHPYGCRPCHFQGGLCWKGLSCSFCHICPKPKRKSKHQRDVDKRRQERYRQVKDDLGIKCLDELTKVDDSRRQIMTSCEEMKKRIKDAYSSGDSAKIEDSRRLVDQIKHTIAVYNAVRPPGLMFGGFVQDIVDSKLDVASNVDNANCNYMAESDIGEHCTGSSAHRELEQLVRESTEWTTTEGSAGSASDLSDEEFPDEKPMPRMQAESQHSADASLAEIQRLREENKHLLSFMCEMVGQHPDACCAAAHAILRMPLLQGPLAKSTAVTFWASEYGNHLENDNLMADFTNVRRFCHRAGVRAELHLLAGDRGKDYWRKFIRESLQCSTKTVDIHYFIGHGCAKGLCINASECLSYHDLQEELAATKSKSMQPKFMPIFADFCCSGALAEDHRKAVAQGVSSAAQIAVVAASSPSAIAWEGRSGGFFTQCFLQCLHDGKPLGLLMFELGGSLEGSFISDMEVQPQNMGSECIQFGCASFPRQWATTLQQIDRD